MSSQHAKRPLMYRKFSRNGMVPDATFQNQLAEATNAAVRWREREVFRYSTPLASIPASASGSRGRWRFAWHTSPYAKNLKARVVMAIESGAGLSSLSPHARLIVLDSSAVEIGRMEIHWGTGSGSDVPDDFGHRSGILTLSGSIVDLPTDEDLFGYWEDLNEARLVSCTVWETSSVASLKTNNAQGTPILDADREDVADRLRNLWKAGASPLAHWTVDLAASPRTNSTTTAKSLIDDTSTTVSAATPGFTLDLANRSTVRRSTVPVTMWVYAARTTSNGSVTLKDSTGAAVVTVSITGTADWYSGTGDLPASAAKYDLHHVAGAAGTISTNAVSLLSYEA